MKTILVTGGTVFVSRYVAEYYVKKGWNVHVLNRNTQSQSDGVSLIQADRHKLGDKLKQYHFDAVLDMTAYNAEDIDSLLSALGSYDTYIMLSSSAVYPEHEPQPFTEQTPLGENQYWGSYGTGKIAAETALLKKDPQAYILRPPYLYGPMNNLYREAFVFDCVMLNRKFYLPGDGSMKLQFFHVEDLCRFMDIILEQMPKQHIFNLGNKEAVTIREWVEACYRIIGKQAEFANIFTNVEQRNYFSFYNYEYYLDVLSQHKLMPTTKSLDKGLKESLEWYLHNPEKVRKKPFMDYIDANLAV